MTPGTRLGPYEVLTLLGAGGMGEVYRAHDTKLNREVALKILPEAVASDPDRLARFTREAQTLAALNHPNIGTIYGIEESQPVRALVMELIEGDDLSVLIGRGPMSLDELLPIARQIADALEAAHDHGIIHRDLKPANIKVRPDGTRQLVDFHPVWSATGRELVSTAAATAAQMAAVDIATAGGVTFGTPARFPASVTGDRTSGQPRAWDILQDGRFIGIVSGTEDATQRSSTPQLRLVLNWFEELKQRVPVP